MQADRERVNLPDSSTQLFHDDTKFALDRIAVFQYLSVGIFLFLICGFWVLQVRDHAANSEMAERNRIKTVPLLAPRGKILDRDGRVIVDNHSAYTVMLTRENLKSEHVQSIADGLNLDPDDLRIRLRRYESRPKYIPVMIKQELSPGELAFVESHRDPETFPEMELIQNQRRLYPHGGLAAHVIGYVGEISEQELNLPEFAKYSQGDVIGKFGLERQYNDTLIGIDGQRRVVVDSMGREREVLESKEATPGHNLQLTLDLDLQAVAELSMENRRGAVVALDPRSGEVLAMVSRPAFDPNAFAIRIRAQDWKELTSNPYNPLMNRAIQAQFAPGSTFKPIVALAGLESGSIDDHFSVHCGGGATFYGRYFKCWIKGAHGAVELHRGIVQSCDVYFYNVGNKTGIDSIAEYAQMAGLGKKTGVDFDLPGEAEGLVPSPKWKLRTQREKWCAGETISVAIGHGAVTVTPIQLASAIGGVASGGVWYRPHLVKGAAVPEPRRGNLHADNIAKVISGMYGVVNEGGTGASAAIPGLQLCGKTGSAQRASNALVKSGRVGREMKDNAWFVGFAPRENPEIVVAVLFENGEHGNLAAPIARDVIKAYFDKKTRLARPSQPQLALFQRPQVPN
ncbi:MAG: penicillin-binding protein 2 [Acidobacteria bacterium]|nr:MAG: penicillin-binding protein 2 [Acidobacteriota bacterium]